MNIAPERIDSLIRLGYTPEEARFLYIVATHSGYFTRRQFLRFSGTRPGKQRFLMKLLAQEHATYHSYQSGARVYHLFSRKVFNAIGRDDLRTRRRHQLDYIKTRIVVLDFVLANVGLDYLETEAEKVPFFETQLKLGRELLPSKVYSSKVSKSQTLRYFVDRFPLFVKEGPGESPLVAFTYMDAGAATLQGFVTHLHAYHALLRALRRFEFTFVAPTDRFFKMAESEFSRLVLGQARITSNGDLLRYFQIRKKWERGERVRAAEVVMLNEAKREFKDETFEPQFLQWSAGVIAEGDICCSVGSSAMEVNGRFSTQTCGDSLSVFYRSGRGRSESSAEMASSLFSPTRSSEVSPG